MTDQLDRLIAALVGRYAIERELGAGGMATVYLAEDLKHHRKVAVKVLRPELAAVLGADRFLQEIEIAAGLRHPNILPLYDSGEAGGFLFYVMPYEKGQSLRERLDREQGLPIPETVAMLREVIDALAEAHENGVVHRDIKPDNIMVSGRHAMVMDFGIAKAVSQVTGSQQLTTAGVALGTPAYMAPEQASGDVHIDHRADIYAVGVMAYEMLAGRLPFTGPTAQAVLAAHIAEQPDPVTKFRDTVPPDLEAAVMRCLAKNPADRWQTARALDQALGAMVTSDPAGTVATAPIKRRNPLALIVGGVAVLAVVGAFALFAPPNEETGASENRVVVFPFSVRAANEQLSYLGEGVAELMATALDGTGDLRSVDPATVIRRVAEESGPVDAVRGETLARDLGAGRFVLGGITDVGGGNIQLRASLYRAGEPDPILVEETGIAEQPLIIVRAVTAQLLAAALGRSIADSAALLTTDSVGALKAYVTGATHYRDGRWNDAIVEFQRAVDVDPDFAMAYHKLAMAAGWAELRPLSINAGAEAVRLSGRLPERQRLILAAADAYHRGDPVDAERNALAVVEAYPDEYEAWYILGETRIHFNHLLGQPMAEALGPLDRVARGDPSRGDVWLHLYHLAMPVRDVDRLEELNRMQGESMYYGTLGRALLAQDTAVLDSLRPARGFSQDALLQLFEVGMLWEDLVEGARRAENLAADNRPPAQVHGQGLAAIAYSGAGQRQKARAALERVEPAMAGYMLPIKGLLALDAFPGWTDSAVAAVRRELQGWDASPMPGCETPVLFLCVQNSWYPVIRLFLIGALFVKTGQSDLGLLYADSLDAYAGTGDAGVLAREKSRTIRALMAEAEGNTTEALRLLEQLEPGRSFEALRDSPFGARSFENATITQLLYTTGQDETALRRYGVQSAYYATWAKARARLQLGEAHERLGQRQEAIAQYDRFLELWKNADAELQPLMEDVRGRISRLVAETN